MKVTFNISQTTSCLSITYVYSDEDGMMLRTYMVGTSELQDMADNGTIVQLPPKEVSE